MGVLQSRNRGGGDGLEGEVVRWVLYNRRLGPLAKCWDVFLAGFSREM